MTDPLYPVLFITLIILLISFLGTYSSHFLLIDV